MIQLIVNGDDFGRSPGINTAIIRAHREGVLTSASLMVNEPAASEAIALARQNPGLAVGLHAVVHSGCTALPPSRIPHIVNGEGRLPADEAGAGFKYSFSRIAR